MAFNDQNIEVWTATALAGVTVGVGLLLSNYLGWNGAWLFAAIGLAGAGLVSVFALCYAVNWVLEKWMFRKK